MRFIEEVRQIHHIGPKKDMSLSALERGNDPQALAAALVGFKNEKSTEPIGPPRASNLYDACMRMHVIANELQLRKPVWENLKSKLLFGFGNAVHFYMQNTDMVWGDNRYGWWICHGCGLVRYFGGPPKKPCEKCGAKAEASYYHEHRLWVRKPVIVSGHPDMFIKVQDRKKLRVVDFKTMEGDAFEKLIAPLVSHVWQVQTYMEYCSTDDTIPAQIDPEIGYVVYVTKRNRQEAFPLKAFVVQRDEALLKRIKAKLMLYKKGIENYPENAPAPMDDCVRQRFENWKAKSCPAFENCKRLQK